MKKITVSVLAVASSLFLVQCANKGGDNTKKMSEADQVSEMQKKFTSAQIAEGKAVFMASCGKCHELFKPEQFSINKWNHVLPDMSQKAELTAEQASKVRAWVIINAKKA